MLSRSVGIVAVCCASASAFLLPPGLVSTTADKDLSFVSVNPKNQLLELPCSSCAFPAPKQEENIAEEDQTFAIQGGANNLILNFTISDDGTALLLNKHAIYPEQNDLRNWFVEQVPASTSRQQIEAGDYKNVPLQVTGSGISTRGPQVASESGDEVIPLKFQILSLEEQPMTIDEVAIQLLRIDGGELLILSAEPIHENMLDSLPFSIGAPSPHHRPEAPKECKSLPPMLCAMLHSMGAKIEDAKHSKLGSKLGHKFGGCGGRKGGRPHKLPGHIRPHFSGMEQGPGRHHGRPHFMVPHHHHGHHEHHHGFMHAFFKGFVAVLVPVMAGIFVGLTVSLVGLFVGKFIGWFWIRVVRRGKHGYASVAHDEMTAEEGESKEEIEQAEAPPGYEDAPPYELSEKNEH